MAALRWSYTEQKRSAWWLWRNEGGNDRRMGTESEQSIVKGLAMKVKVNQKGWRSLYFCPFGFFLFVVGMFLCLVAWVSCLSICLRRVLSVFLSCRVSICQSFCQCAYLPGYHFVYLNMFIYPSVWGVYLALCKSRSFMCMIWLPMYV